MRNLRTVLLVALAASLALGAAGCWGRQTRRDVYLNLMEPVERARFLEMEAEYKPATLQLAYLQEIGVYQKWVEQPKEIQEAVLDRQVQEGMTPLQVRMAWGPPAVRDTRPDPAAEAEMVWYYDPDAQDASPDAFGRSVGFRDGAAVWTRGTP